MKPAEVKRALEIVDGAHDLTERELETYLDSVCGEDSLLRREVLEYLDYARPQTIVSGGPSGENLPKIPEAKSETRYQLGDEIARGGMGVVLHAFDNNLRRQVAVKILKHEGENNPDIVRRFLLEAHIGGQLQHPGIAPVYEIGRLPDGHPFIAMKLVNGETLQTLLEQRQDLADGKAKFLGIFEQVCQAVAYAHGSGVVHRDLKPANVMVGEFGEVQVMDWGIAKLMSDDQSNPVEAAPEIQPEPAGTANEDSIHEATPAFPGSQVDSGGFAAETRIGVSMGTPAYMPPEQMIGRVTRMSDVFSLGAMLCEILTGEATAGDLVAARDRLDRCGAEHELCKLAAACIEQNPADRPADAGVVATRISDYLDAFQARLKQAEIATARAEVRVTEERRRRQRMLWTIAAVGLLLLIASIAGPMIAFYQAELREEADQQRDNAVAAREEETLAKKLAVQAAEETRRTLYFAEMNLASLTTLDSTGLRTIRDLTQKWIPQQGEADLRGWEWHYLNGLYRYDLFSYEGHQAEVTAVEFSPDGSRAASLDRSGTLCLWMATDGTNSSTWKAKARPGSSLAWNPSGDELAFFDPSGQLIRIFADSGEVAMRAPLPNPWVRWLVWSPDGKRFATVKGGKNELLIVNASTGELEESIETGFDFVRSLCWSPDGSQIAMDSAAWQSKIWSLETGSPVSKPCPWRSMRFLTWSPDGKYLAGEFNGQPAFSIAVLDARTLEEVDRFEGHFDFVTSVQWSKDSRKVISNCWDRTVRIWELGERDERLVIPCIEHPADISWNAATGQIAITEGKRVRVVDGKSDAVPSLKLTSSRIETIDEIRWNPDGSRLLFTCVDGTAGLWNPDADSPDTNDAVREFPLGLGKGVHSACWSPDGTRFAAAAKDIVICSVADGAELTRLDGHRGSVLSVDWSPGGSRLASCGQDGAIRLWDAESGDELGEISPEGASFTGRSDVRWSPDEKGDQLAVFSKAKVYVLDSRSFALVKEFESRDASPIDVFAWDPAGSRIAIGSMSGTIELFDAHSGKVVQTLRGHEGGTRGLQWNPDGSRLASTGADRMIRVWDPETGLVALTIQASRGPVVQLAWSPDGRRLVSTASPGTLKVWDAGEDRAGSTRQRRAPSP